MFRDRFVDHWEDRWTSELHDALRAAVVALSAQLEVEDGQLGVLPAVYFPRLRMGSVIFRHWGASERDTTLAMPWNPAYVPPPFTCFAPPIEEEDEPRVSLITRVASYVDRFQDPSARAWPWIAPTPNDAFVGTVTWTMDEGIDDGVVDADQLVESGVRQVSVAYVLPSLLEPPLYVPLFYIQAAVPYDGEVLALLMHRAARSGGTAPGTAAIHAALLAVGRAARLRASQWLNPKTQLLSQAGFDGLKDDLQRRVAEGELYAECFFDIDAFKVMNDRYGYVGADLIAAKVVDRVLFEVQRSVAAEYAAYRTKQPLPYGKPNGFRALLAHVSGDEFKFFARSNLTAATSQGVEVERARDWAGGIVQVAASDRSPQDESRLSRTIRCFSTTRLFHNQHVVANVQATVSLGVAVAAPDASWPISQNDALHKKEEIDEKRLRRARAALDELDGLAERALFGAKRVVSRALLSTELLAEGGRLAVSADGALLLLGRMDGLLEGDTFDVFGTDARDKQLTTVCVGPLREEDRRTAPVNFLESAPVEGRLDDYYVRFRARSSSATPFVTALLTTSEAGITDSVTSVGRAHENAEQ